MNTYKTKEEEEVNIKISISNPQLRMDEFKFKHEFWTIRKLKEYCDNGKLEILPHQRPLKLKKNHVKTFIQSVLNNDMMDVPLKFANIESCRDKCKGTEDEEFFNFYLEQERVYTVEDGQHRIVAIQEVDESHFKDELEGEMDDFLNSKIIVFIYYNATREELIRKFGTTNGSRTVTTAETLWGQHNEFNQSVKDMFVNNENYIRLYGVKKKSDSIERILYGNVIKMLKVCGFHDGIGNSANTSSMSMLSFVISNLDINRFTNCTSLFDKWYSILSTKDQKVCSTFAYQSNLLFLLHILKNKNIEWDNNQIDGYVTMLSDSRSSAEKRYEFILSDIKNERN